MRMRASTCDVASRTSFDSSGDEDGREPVLRDQADRAAHGAAHRGHGGLSCLSSRGRGVELDNNKLSKAWSQRSGLTSIQMKPDATFTVELTLQDPCRLDFEEWMWSHDPLVCTELI